eukprot:4498429-Pleurochrysis_carterae.AAC.1
MVVDHVYFQSCLFEKGRDPVWTVEGSGEEKENGSGSDGGFDRIWYMRGQLRRAGRLFSTGRSAGETRGLVVS